MLMKRRAERGQPQVFAPGKINVKVIKSRGREYRQRWCYIPARLIDSGKFPFADDEPILFVIDEQNERLVIQKITPRPV